MYVKTRGTNVKQKDCHTAVTSSQKLRSADYPDGICDGTNRKNVNTNKASHLGTVFF